MSTAFSIYTVKKYIGMTSLNFDENLIQFESIEDIVEELTTVNNSYHFRVHPNTTYIFFGDLDHFHHLLISNFNLHKAITYYL